MAMSMRQLVLLITLLSAWTSSSLAQDYKVEIFYETLSDASHKFFTEQFKLVSDNLLSNIDLRLYPYGNTVSDGATPPVYTCPFEGVQCEANRIHACLINTELAATTPFKSSKNVASYVKAQKPKAVTDAINEAAVSSFVNCFFKNRFALDNIEDLGERCLPADGLADWAEIRTCVFDPEAYEPLNAELAAITGEVESEIEANGLVIRFDGTTVNDAARSNLVGEICRAINKQDGICLSVSTEPLTKVTLGVYYEAFNRDAGNYIVKQLGSYYHVLEDFVDIDLVPYGNTQFESVSGNYTCNNDPQCISNKFQALVVDTYIGKPKNGDPVSGENRAINFLGCLFTTTLGDTFQALEACSNQKLEPDDYRTFLEYIKMDDPIAKTAFESMRTKTAAVAALVGGTIPRLPLVTLNEKVDYNAFDDLVQEACAQYTGPIKASICTKVNITVLYEPLHHKSRTLFLEQLKPVFHNLYNLINLQLNPAGRAVLNPGHGIACKGGMDQCNAMKLQACTLDYFWNDGNNYTDPIRQEVFEFLWCTFKNKKLLNVMDAAELCSEEFLEFDAWWTIHGCYQEGTGTAILAEYIEEAQSTIVDIEHHNIPIVILNEVEVTDQSNIKALVCQLFDDYHSPDFCFSDMAPKVQLKVFYEAFNEGTKYFFTSQFEPWYMYVEEMANIDLLPAGNVKESIKDDGTCDSYDPNSVCLANKFQAYIIDKYSKHDDDGDFIDGTLRTAEFLACYFNHPEFNTHTYNAAEYCAEEKLKDDEWFELITSVKSPEGNAIYKAILDLTAEFKTANGLTSFDILPWVTLDTNNHSKRAADDLLQTVCSQYLGDKPPECTPVQVQVYYSAINPQSRRFFLDQLIPTFRNLRERIHLDLIPYGVTDPAQSITQECSTKLRTCDANKGHACAIDLMFQDEVIDSTIQWDGRNQTLQFIQCMFKNQKNQEVSSNVEACANQNFILADEVMDCFRQEGHEHLSGMRNKTMGQFQSMEHAPWIVINGLRSALGQSDLKQAVCNAIVGDKPNYCFEATPQKVKVELHYSTVSNDAQSYVINELYPHYRKLEEIIDLDIVPFGLMEIIEQTQGSKNYTLICPGGPAECEANEVHACIYAQYFHADDDPISDSNDEREYDHKLMVIEYLNCYFTSAFYPSKPMDAAMSCVELIFNDDFSTVHQCVATGMAINILKEFEETKVQRLLPHITYTPWITVNGKHSYSIENHIQRTVCDSYIGREKPLDCFDISDAREKPWVYLHYEIGDAGSSDFFTRILDPSLSSGVADIHLVPFGRSTVGNCINNLDCSQYKQHACIIKLHYETRPVTVLKTLACTFGELINDENVVNKCVDIHLEEEVPDAWRPIETCVLDNGDTLLNEYAANVAALKPKITHVPWILINEEHNIEAEVNFVSEICYAFYPADKPALCQPSLVPVGVYYETSNSEVNTFLASQLAQYGEYLDEIAAFSFIPFGTTQQQGNSFTCGKENQCVANTVHTCILNRFYNSSSVNPDTEFEKNRIRFVQFLECTAVKELQSPILRKDPVLIAEECLDINFEGDLWRDIHFCYAGPEGQELYSEMGRQTRALTNPTLQTAPYVTINGQYSSNGLLNLFQALCNSYGLVKAPLCSTLSLGTKVGFYFSANAAAQSFFITQVLPFYKEIVPTLRNGTNEALLHSLLVPDLVAWGETSYDTTNNFTCASSNECYLNRVFACVEHHHGDEKRYYLRKMEFALCLFQSNEFLTSPTSAVNTCLNAVWILDPFPQIEECATENTPEAHEIFLKAQKKTQNFPEITTFPAVVVENRVSEAAKNDLLKVACESYKGYDYPTECGAYTPTTPVPTTVSTTVTTPTQTGPTQPVTTTTTTAPVTTTTTTAPVTTTTGSTGSSEQPTTPGGSGTTPTVSILVLLVSFCICRFVY